MAHKPRQIKLTNLEKLLRKAYAKPDADKYDGVLYSHAITEEQLRATLRLATPFYELLNSELDPRPQPYGLDPEDWLHVSNYSAALREAGVKIESRELIPLTKPSLSDPADWLFDQDDWEKHLPLVGFELEPIEKMFERLLADSTHTLPDDLRRRLNQIDPDEPFLTRHLMGLWTIARLIMSHAEHQITPKQFHKELKKGRVTVKKKIALIEELVPYMLRWPLLGMKPGEPKTLCILVR